MQNLTVSRIALITAMSLSGAAGFWGRSARAGTSDSDPVRVLKLVDERQRNQGDSRVNVYIEQTEREKLAVVYEATVYRRSSDRRFMILFNAPKAQSGQGYLRADDNLWFYNPEVGVWERRTERERVGGTNSRRADLDESSLAEEYDPEASVEESLGVHTTWKLTLKSKAGREVAFPVVKIWVDKATNNVLKRQDYALSGRLLRTAYYTKWRHAFSPSKKAEVWYAEEARLYDEVEKENSTVILTKSIDLKPLPANLFTKAWLESKAR